jgi:hypothetical protein
MIRRRIHFVILAVLVVATAGIYAMFAHDLATALARLVNHSETIETSFGTVEYAVMGEGEHLHASWSRFRDRVVR